MIDERTLELIHGEIDGTNSERHSAELRELLATDPDARDLLGELESLRRILGRVGHVNPPTTLGEKIMGAIGSSHPEHPGMPSGSGARAFSRAWMLRYAYAFAIGLIVGVAVYHFAFTGGPAWETSDLYGAMAPDRAGAGTAAVEVDLPGVTGSIGVVGANSAVRVDLDLSGVGALDVQMDFEADDLALRGFEKNGDETTAVDLHPGRVMVRGEGRQRFAAVFEKKVERTTTIELRFFQSGDYVGSRSLEVPASG